MANTAKKEITCGQNNHYHLYMTIAVNKQDVANNKSNVTVKMYAKSDSTNYHAYNLDDTANTVKLTVDGSQKINKKMAMDFREKATVNMASWTGDINHGTDGKKKLTCSGSFSISGTSSLSSGSISCDIMLDDIPRATKPGLSVKTVELGTQVTIKISAAVSTWSHELYYKIASGSWNKIATGIKSDYNWKIPKDIANSFKTSESGTITIGLNTLNGSTKIGTTQTTDIKITIPEDMKPSVSDIGVVEGVKDLELFGSGFIQNKSKLKFSVTASGSYGSTIKTYKYVVGGTQAYTDANKTYTMTDSIKNSGNVPVKVEVTDTRGRKGEKTINVQVEAYKNPEITTFICERCGRDGKIDNNGKYAKITAKFAIAPINNDNSKSYEIAYKQQDEDEWTVLVNGESYNYDSAYISGECFNVENAYEIRLLIKDSFTSASITRNIGTAIKLISYIRKKTAIAIGKIAEIMDAIEIAIAAVFQKNVTFNGDVTFNSKVMTTQKVLWSGAIWPTDSQAAPLNERISEQRNGIVLVWARYVDGEGAKDEQLICSFVPKKIVETKGGRGHAFVLMPNSLSTASVKYVYVADQKLTGHANNATEGTGNNGIKYNNKYFALVQVIGV